MIPFRPVGVSSSVSRVSMVARAADVTSMIGEAPETVTDSSSDPTRRLTSTCATNPTVNRTFSRRTVWNPESVYDG
jgi:hypothetical protein